MTEPLLSIQGVQHFFPNGTQALRPVDIDITTGTFLSIVGPSGCGKSTLLRLAAGLIQPTSGHVHRNYDNKPGNIGFVFQDATLMPWATVAQNVALPLELAHLPVPDHSNKVAAALQRVGLSDFASAFPRQLSGGMRMRVSIARAMVTNPRLLLMDEPFAALDEFTRFRLNDDLSALWAENKWTVVFVTHSVREAVYLSQRVVVMSPRPGRIVSSVDINLPLHRTPDLRLSHLFADECAKVSRLMEQVMNESVAS